MACSSYGLTESALPRAHDERLPTRQGSLVGDAPALRLHPLVPKRGVAPWPADEFLMGAELGDAAVLKDGVAHVQAGAGIVADSDPDKEYMESINKAGAVVDALKKAQEMNK